MLVMSGGLSRMFVLISILTMRRRSWCIIPPPPKYTPKPQHPKPPPPAPTYPPNRQTQPPTPPIPQTQPPTPQTTQVATLHVAPPAPTSPPPIQQQQPQENKPTPPPPIVKTTDQIIQRLSNMVHFPQTPAIGDYIRTREIEQDCEKHTILFTTELSTHCLSRTYRNARIGELIGPIEQIVGIRDDTGPRLSIKIKTEPYVDTRYDIDTWETPYLYCNITRRTAQQGDLVTAQQFQEEQAELQRLEDAFMDDESEDENMDALQQLNTNEPATNESTTTHPEDTNMHVDEPETTTEPEQTPNEQSQNQPTSIQQQTIQSKTELQKVRQNDARQEQNQTS